MPEKVLIYSRFPKAQMERFGERFELLQRERRLQPRQHAFDQSSVQLADELPVLVDELAERTAPQRHLDGLASVPAEPRLEPGLGHGLLEQGKVAPGKSPRRKNVVIK